MERECSELADAVLPARPPGQREGDSRGQAHGHLQNGLPAVRSEDERRRPYWRQRHLPEQLLRLQREGERDVGRI